MRRKQALLLGGVMVGIFLALGTCPGPPRGARESAKRSACTSNLRQLYVAVQEYRSAHEGDYPGSLEELYPVYTSSHDILRCVATKRKFIYLGGEGRLTDDSILAYDHPDNHNKAYGESVRPCVLVLLNNGKVVPMSPKEFRERLRNQVYIKTAPSSGADAPRRPGTSATKPISSEA